MSKTKLIVSLILVLALLSVQAGTVLAAPLKQEAPLTGTVDSITLETNTSGETTVLVTLTDDAGVQQTVRLSVDTAVDLNLVTIDEAGNPVVNEAAIGSTITIDPGTVIPNEETEGEQHPVASALEEFFSSVLGIDYETIMSVHEGGVGFGVIAQALWLTNALDGDAELFQLIVDAKQSGDFSAIVLPNGSSPKNWGQFRKALLDNKENLGQIMSGHATISSEETTTTTTDPSSNKNGKGKESGQGNGQGNGNSGGNGNGNGNGNGHKP